MVSLVHLQQNISDAFQIPPKASFLPRQFGRSCDVRSACFCANKPENLPGENDAMELLQERQLSLLLDFQKSLSEAKKDLTYQIDDLEREKEHLAQKAAESQPEFVYEDDDLPTGFDSLPWSEGV
jgi:hypothetical protein